MAKSNFVYCQALVDVPPVDFNAKKLWLTGQMTLFLSAHPNAPESEPEPEPAQSGTRRALDAACTPVPMMITPGEGYGIGASFEGVQCGIRACCAHAGAAAGNCTYTLRELA